MNKKLECFLAKYFPKPKPLSSLTEEQLTKKLKKENRATIIGYIGSAFIAGIIMLGGVSFMSKVQSLPEVAITITELSKLALTTAGATTVLFGMMVWFLFKGNVDSSEKTLLIRMELRIRELEKKLLETKP